MRTQVALTDFSRKADALISSDPCEGFFRLKDHFRHLLFETDLLKTVSLRELHNIAADPSYQSAAWEPNYIVFAGGPPMPSAAPSALAFSWCLCWFQLDSAPNDILSGEPPGLAFNADNEWKQT